jgi:hypothetical protein
VWKGLEGCRLKFNAGLFHMQRFQDAAYGFLESHPDLVVFRGEPNAQRTKYVFRVEGVRVYPVRDWGIILGDAVHCLRSMLDQLAYTLADDPSPQTAFPICLTEKEWVTRAPAQYWSISPGFIKFLDHVQPYHRSDPTAHPLAILRALSNLDKHRGIPTITLVPDEYEATVRAATGIREWSSFTFKFTAYEKGAVAAECKIVPLDADAQLHMDVEIQTTLDVAFGEVGAAPTIRHTPVDVVMEEVVTFIAKQIIEVIGDIWNQAVIEADAVDDAAKEWM